MSQATESNTAPAPEAHLPPAMQADRTLLEWIGDWRIYRARQTLIWAENEQRESLGDTSYKVDTDALNRMKILEDLIGGSSPKSLHCAVKMLGVAHTILSHEDPDEYFADGPVVEILRTVIKALEYCKGGEPVGEFLVNLRKSKTGNGEVEPMNGDTGATTPDHPEDLLVAASNYLVAAADMTAGDGGIDAEHIAAVYQLVTHALGSIYDARKALKQAAA